ncbi:hypothetical protein E2C01_023818 [Portunus trituberculatus]|uniref:Uncharacterized protein n=1 Tax=Portunus trituberculatus TaxID=210409 RepID=A0A5B7E8Z5_PORTR|nr:hypothetical protein [Portunus trituberculatus]
MHGRHEELQQDVMMTEECQRKRNKDNGRTEEKSIVGGCVSRKNDSLGTSLTGSSCRPHADHHLTLQDVHFLFLKHASVQTEGVSILCQLAKTVVVREIGQGVF